MPNWKNVRKDQDALLLDKSPCPIRVERTDGAITAVYLLEDSNPSLDSCKRLVRITSAGYSYGLQVCIPEDPKEASDES